MLRHRNKFVKYFINLMKEMVAETGQTPRCCKWGVSTAADGRTG